MKKNLLISAILAATACAAYAQTAPEEQKAAPAIKVEKIVTAASVENREPVGETSTFDSTTTQVYTWTKITSEQVPAAIKHVYYHNDKLVREITLSVNSSPYRVWSVKNVTPGNWKVDVTDEAGTVLASATFTVGGPAPEAAK
ncbi:MAG: DUF2914 domain-containing protein [Elusimicrobiota bacterium]|nr:DUF2914 domain-containing protein [Elusimicrobiota bacterium]